MTLEEYKENANKLEGQLNKIEWLQNKINDANGQLERCNSILNWSAPKGYTKMVTLTCPQFVAYACSTKDDTIGGKKTEAVTIYLADGMAEDLLNNLKDYYVNKANNAKLELIEYLKSIGITDIDMNDAMFGKNK